jgi:tRNA G18 (ribose-2'-O)-methylase SpoU
MGAVFSLPWARLVEWTGTPDRLHSAGFVTVALTPGGDATDLDSVSERLRGKPKLAVMVGTEGAGLSERWTACAAYRLRIPMTAGIDSLNVAAATAIACYSLSVRGETGQSSG